MRTCLKFPSYQTSKPIACIFSFTSSCFLTFSLKVEFFMLLSFFPSPWEPGYKKTRPYYFKVIFVTAGRLRKKFPAVVIIINFKLFVTCGDDLAADKLHTGELQTVLFFVDLCSAYRITDFLPSRRFTGDISQ